MTIEHIIDSIDSLAPLSNAILEAQELYSAGQ